MNEDQKNMASSTSDKREIVINLNQTDSESINSDCIIQIDALERIQCLINDFINVKKDTESGDKDFFKRKRFNNSILLHGQRGYGKTTFAKSIMNKYYAEKSAVHPLIFIDPTLIKSSENLLIHIIDALITNVKESLNSCCNNQKDQESFKTALLAVSDGLRSLSESHSNHTWILNNSLSQAHSDRNLENCINELFKISAKILKKELFLIILDDVDTNTEKAYETLEMIRCYMSSPYICTIVIGDTNLYRYIILRKKAEELALQTMDSFDGMREKFELLSRNLEEQYFFKIFDTSRQIPIARLDQILSKRKNKILFRVSPTSEKIEIEKFLGAFFKEVCNLPLEKRDSYIYFLASIPLRTIFQLFYNVFIQKKFSEDRNSYNIDGLRFVENLEHSFELGEFFETQENFYRFALSCLMFYAHEGTSKDSVCGYLIEGNTKYNIKNIYISSKIKNPSNQYNKTNGFEIFTCYMICVCAGFYFHDTQKKEKSWEILEKIENLSKNTDLIDFSKEMSSYLVTSEADEKNFGIFRILKSVKQIKNPHDQSTLEIWKKNFDSAFPDMGKKLTEKDTKSEANSVKFNREINKSISDFSITEFQENLRNFGLSSLTGTKAFIALHAFRSSCFQAKSSQGNLDYFSTVQLISVISRISKCKNLSADILTEFVSEFDLDWSDFFYTNAPYEPASQDPFFLLKTHQENIIKSERQKQANMLLEGWILEKNELSGLSQFLAGKIWKRFYQACSTISINEKDCAGIVLQRFILLFINASLIEEFNWGSLSDNCDREKTGYMFHAKNPNKSFHTLRTNLNKIIELSGSKSGMFSISKNFPFTITLLRSPIISQFIAYTISGNVKDSGILIAVKKFIDNDKDYEMLYGEEAVQSSRLVLMYISLLMVQG